MKKLLLAIACAASVTAAYAQDEAATQAETITNNDGVYTIEDNFAVNVSRIQKSTATAPGAAWTVEDGAAVSYVCFQANWADTEGLRLLTVEGAYLQFTIADYNCQTVSIPYTATANSGKFVFYAGSEPIQTLEIKSKDDREGTWVINVPEEYQTAGTVYKIQTGYVDAANSETGEVQYKCRMGFKTMTFTCTEKAKTKWAEPVCNIPDGSWIKAGQVIKFTWEDGGRLRTGISYSGKTDDVAFNAQGEWVVPEITGANVGIKITASVANGNVSSGSTQKDEASDAVVYLFHYTDGTKTVFAEKTFTGLERGDEDNDVVFNYNLKVVNFLAQVSVRVVVYDADGNAVATESVVNKPEVTPAAEDDTEEVTPIQPTDLSGKITVRSLDKGNYTAKVQYRLGTSGEFTDMDLAAGLNENDLEFEIPFSASTAIEEINTEKGTAAPVYYDLKGHRVTPRKGMGILIEVRGTMVRKIDC